MGGGCNGGGVGSVGGVGGGEGTVRGGGGRAVGVLGVVWVEWGLWWAVIAVSRNVVVGGERGEESNKTRRRPT